jgi:hypothetical protein
MKKNLKALAAVTLFAALATASAARRGISRHRSDARCPDRASGQAWRARRECQSGVLVEQRDEVVMITVRISQSQVVILKRRGAVLKAIGDRWAVRLEAFSSRPPTTGRSTRVRRSTPTGELGATVPAP